MFHKTVDVDVWRWSMVSPSGSWGAEEGQYAYSHTFQAPYQPFSSLASYRDRQMFANVTGLLTPPFNTDIQENDELVIHENVYPGIVYPSGYCQERYERVATIERFGAIIPHLEVYVTYTQWDRR